jgi:hypothetical protein
LLLDARLGAKGIIAMRAVVIDSQKPKLMKIPLNILSR